MTSLRESMRSATTPATRPKTGERDEAPERERADRERRARQLDHEPGERDVLHPRARERHELAGEEDAVVAVPAKAAERARPQGEGDRRHAFASTSFMRAGRAASTVSSSPASRALSRLASHVVRRARTRRMSRSPSAVSVRPTRRRSSLERTRSRRPARSSRSTWPTWLGQDPLLGSELGERHSRAALHEPRSGAWRGVIPSCSVSFRSSRARRR